MRFKFEYIFLSIATVCMVVFSISVIKANEEAIHVTSSATNASLSNQKIGWGIKREKDHKQPDLGAKNKELIEKYNGIAMGRADSKNVYLTFDNDALDKVAEMALESKTGARGLRAIMEDILEDVMFSMPSENNVSTINITRNYIEGTEELSFKRRDDLKISFR